MAGRTSFWDGIDEDSGEMRLDLARQLYDSGTSIEDIAEQLEGPLTTLEAKLCTDKGTGPAPPQRAKTGAAPAPRTAAAVQDPVRPGTESETPTPLFNAATEEELRSFIAFRKLDKSAEQFFMVVAFLKSRKGR